MGEKIVELGSRGIYFFDFVKMVIGSWKIKNFLFVLIIIGFKGLFIELL